MLFLEIEREREREREREMGNVAELASELWMPGADGPEDGPAPAARKTDPLGEFVKGDGKGGKGIGKKGNSKGKKG